MQNYPLFFDCFTISFLEELIVPQTNQILSQQTAMRKVAHWFSNLDVYKEKVANQGSTTGIFFSFIYIFLSIVIVVLVILNSYLPSTIISPFGYTTSEVVKYESLRTTERAININFHCGFYANYQKNESLYDGCLIIPIKTDPTVKINEGCAKIQIIKKGNLLLCFGYDYHIFLNELLPARIDTGYLVGSLGFDPFDPLKFTQLTAPQSAT
jgi:hypothetical protein